MELYSGKDEDNNYVRRIEMAEALRHALGICGDHWHPSLLNISAFFVAVGGSISYIKYKVKSLWKKED